MVLNMSVPASEILSFSHAAGDNSKVTVTRVSEEEKHSVFLETRSFLAFEVFEYQRLEQGKLNK